MRSRRRLPNRVCQEGSNFADQGTPDEIVENPRNERTQQFLSAIPRRGKAVGLDLGGD